VSNQPRRKSFKTLDGLAGGGDTTAGDLLTLVRLTVTVSGISELNCARCLLGYNDGGAEGKHP